MEPIILTNGIFGSNSYIIESKNQCAIIDCGNKPQDIKRIIDSRGLETKYIILTHGHADHIFMQEELRILQVPLFAFTKVSFLFTRMLIIMVITYLDLIVILQILIPIVFWIMATSCLWGM